MSVNTMAAVFGAFLAIFIGFLLRVSSTSLGISVLVLGGVALVCYLIATVTARSGGTEEPPVTGLTRGALIGINAVLNGYLAYLIIAEIANSETAGLVVGLVLGGLNFIASIGAVSNWGVYQGLIGWLNWVLPLSWVVVALGLVFIVVSVIFHLIGWLIFRVEFLKLGIPDGKPLAGRLLEVKWETGSFFIFGGLIANLNYRGTAFNMGNFSFVSQNSSAPHFEHESGHSLSLAAFGSLVHFVGALDEVFSDDRALTEKLADSHAGATGLLMWS